VADSTQRGLFDEGVLALAIVFPTVARGKARIRTMFGNIARRYDLLNHLLSLNIDRYWRWRTTRLAPPCVPTDGVAAPILDVCTGTGDLALAYDANGKPLPGVAQVAMQGGSYVAKTIGKRIQGKMDIKPFHYLNKGELAVIGAASATVALGAWLAFVSAGLLIAWAPWLTSTHPLTTTPEPVT